MPTVTVTSSATALSANTTGSLQVVNTGSVQATITATSVGSVVLWPGGKTYLTLRGSAASARTPTGTTTFAVTEITESQRGVDDDASGFSDGRISYADLAPGARSGLAGSSEMTNTYAAKGTPSATPGIPCSVPTFDGDLNITHPSVVYAENGFAGHRYWMAFTPYPNSAREDPSIVYSDDGVMWLVPTGLTNPIYSNAQAVAAGYTYNSDTELMLVGSALWLYWRSFGPVNEIIWRSTSTDGVTWSTPAIVLTVTTAGRVDALSPTIVQEADGTYTMWTVKDTVNGVTRRTSPNGTTWSAASDCTIPSGVLPWHIQVKRIGTKYYMLLNSRQGVRLYYYTSTDGVTWTGRTSPAVPVSGVAGENAHYRSCFIPVAGSPLRWKVWVSGKNDSTVIWRLILMDGIDLEVGPLPKFGSRRVFLPAQVFASKLGSPVNGEIGGRYQSWLLDATTTESVKGQTVIPEDWRSCRATIYWANGASGTGDVAWGLLVSYGTVGQDLTTKDAALASFAVGTAPAANVLATTTTGTVNLLTGHASFVAIQLQRRGTDAADTLANDAAFLGVLLEEAEGY